jgi:predicted transcriptional regulator
MFVKILLSMENLSHMDIIKEILKIHKLQSRIAGHSIMLWSGLDWDIQHIVILRLIV